MSIISAQTYKLVKLFLILFEQFDSQGFEHFWHVLPRKSGRFPILLELVLFAGQFCFFGLHFPLQISHVSAKELHELGFSVRADFLLPVG